MKYATIDGFAELTPQQVFDISKNHLLSQSERSTDARGNCVYRGEDGKMCAAGPFLKDEEAAKFEDNSWLSLMEKEVIPPDHADLVFALQGIHDGTFPDEWESELRILAYKYDLTYHDWKSHP